MNSKYQSTIDRITSGTYSRSELVALRANVVEKVRGGDDDARDVVTAIDRATPSDKTMVFMGFCPDADFSNRLDIGWKEKGICTFDYLDSARQVERFNDIWAGDLVILKKRQVFGKTMRLYGFGRVSGVKYDEKDRRYLEMRWSDQKEELEVPLMACNDTVNVRTLGQVEAEMPPEFFRWLGWNSQAAGSSS